MENSGPEAILRCNTTETVVAGNGSGDVIGNPVVAPLGFTFDDANRIHITE